MVRHLDKNWIQEDPQIVEHGSIDTAASALLQQSSSCQTISGTPVKLQAARVSYSK